jgi:hypothetical protein
MLRTALQRSGTALLFSGGGRAIAGEVRGKSHLLFFLQLPRAVLVFAVDITGIGQKRACSVRRWRWKGGRGVFRCERRGSNSMGALFFRFRFSSIVSSPFFFSLDLFFLTCSFSRAIKNSHSPL